MSGQFTEQDLDEALEDLAMLEYFPRESRPSIKLLLARICPHKEALSWLISEMVNHIGKWPGPKELRGLLCTRYDAADGVDEWCSLPGYSPADCEARSIAQHERLKLIEKTGGYSKELLEIERFGSAKQHTGKNQTEESA